MRRYVVKTFDGPVSFAPSVLSPKYVHVSLRSKWAAGKARILKRYVTDEQRSRRPIFIATLRAVAGWLFFLRRGGSLRIESRYARRYRQSGSDRLEKQPTDLRRRHHYMRDGALAKGSPEVSGHIANEAVNGRLRDAVPYDCVHGFSQWTERWFVQTVEVQLRFSRCYWID